MLILKECYLNYKFFILIHETDLKFFPPVVSVRLSILFRDAWQYLMYNPDKSSSLQERALPSTKQAKGDWKGTKTPPIDRNWEETWDEFSFGLINEESELKFCQKWKIGFGVLLHKWIVIFIALWFASQWTKIHFKNRHVGRFGMN